MQKSIILILTLFTLVTNAQVIKLRAKQSAFIDYKKNEKIEWNASDFLIIINTKDKKITIYSDQKIEFSYYKTQELPRETNKNYDTFGSKALQFKCIDNDGKECNITFTALDKNQSSYNSRVSILYSTYGLMINVDPEQ